MVMGVRAYGDVGVLLAWLLVGDDCAGDACCTAILRVAKGYSLNDRCFLLGSFLLRSLPTRPEKLSLYDLLRLDVNISTFSWQRRGLMASAVFVQR